MPRFRVYYGDGTVLEGDKRNDWRAMPTSDVQAITIEDLNWRSNRVRRYFEDPSIWPEGIRVQGKIVIDGLDSYEIENWGNSKLGRLIDTTSFFTIYNQACREDFV